MVAPTSRQQVPAEDRVIMALDVPSLDEASAWAKRFPQLRSFKVGLQLFTQEGPRVVQEVARSGARVFLDLKFHDIPNTVARAVESAVMPGVFMMNLHIAAGPEALKRAAEACNERAAALGIEKPILLGVTLLTSLTEADLRWAGVRGEADTEQLVVTRAVAAQECGLDGVVASAREAPAIRAACGDGFVIVTPGIRLRSGEDGDQKRVVTPGSAVAKGSDYLVIGRPIREAVDPAGALAAIVDDIEMALAKPKSIEGRDHQ